MGCVSAYTATHYTAAVWQNSGRHQSTNVSATQQANLANMDRVMQIAAREHKADIIVFSEGGITESLWYGDPGSDGTCEPIPEAGALPCTANTAQLYPVTYSASCLARKHSMVTVINTCDKQRCEDRNASSGLPPCPNVGYELFNTQLAFDEDGTLLAKYHKMHNYDPAPSKGETNLLCCWPPRPDSKWFDTRFGVRFGMQICFDIMFREPAAAMAIDGVPAIDVGKKRRKSEHDDGKLVLVKDFVLSTHWETPGPPMMPAIEVEM